MRLIIAEKKSLADAIAAALPKVKKEQMCMISGDDVVAWSAGHILRLKKPDEYNSEWKSWKSDSLPMFPDDYDKMLVPSEATMGIFNNLKALLKKADCVVNAGDADREGQLLIDEILNYCGYKGKVYRLLLTDLSSEAVKKSLASMKPNEEYKGIYEAGLGRQRADWLVGMNMSRVYTITSERNFGQSISVGRVQTPTLALVVNRDKEIEKFVPEPYFEVYGDFAVGADVVKAKWQPFGLVKKKKGDSEEEVIIDRPGFDTVGRVIDSAVAEDLKVRLVGKNGRVCGYKSGKENSAPSAPYSLPQLEIEASQYFGFAPKETLAICQKLYEARILTYPRSDCSYLPMSVYDDRNKILAAAKAIIEKTEQNTDVVFRDLDMSLKRNVFNDSKVEEHFAIIPTGQMPSGSFDEKEWKILDLVARRFVAQFMPNAEYVKAEISFEVEREFFKASSKVKTYDGWKTLYGKFKKSNEDVEEEDGEYNVAIPVVAEGATSVCREILTTTKKTTPPKRFTEASLLQAMNSVYKFVKNPDIKRVLKETQGIGTAATQATIISELIEKRGFIQKKGKTLVSTEIGRKLIDSLDETMTTPDLTALWEMQLDDIAHNKERLHDFMNDVKLMVQNLVDTRLKVASVVEAVGASSNAIGLKHCDCPACGKIDGMRLLNGKFGKYWKCDCGFHFSGAAAPKGTDCPFCGSIMLRRKSSKSSMYFWKCEKSDCNAFLPDDKGSPAKVTWCPKCKSVGQQGVCIRHLSKDGKKHYWKCEQCNSFFDDNKGNLAPKM